MAGASAGVAPKRLSTAAQFFSEEDLEESTEMKKSTYDKVVDLLNQASLMLKDTDKTANLRQVQELIVHKDPDLLDNFLDEMIAFQNDRSVDVKKCIIGFMEEACKKDPECLLRVVPSLAHLLQDENVNVLKKVILTFSNIFRYALQWISKAKTPKIEMTAIWEQINQMKTKMISLLDSDNDGIRTHIVKFMEGLTLTLSKKTVDSEVPKKQENEFSLDQVVENNRLVRLKKLEEEGQNHFVTLVQFQGSLHISSINLMTVMGALTNIARQRPNFFDQVVQSFEALHVNLPPTLAKSQVSSVRKNLKMQMMMLLRHSSSVDFVPQITTLLTDLGASQSEITKALPKEEGRKRKIEEPGTANKKAKIEQLPEVDDDDDIGMTPWTDRSKKQPTAMQRQTAIDITADELLPRLSVQNVADLVLLSMVMLPENMPAQFQATYTPIAAAGTEAQIKHISRLLATQLTMAGMGKGIGELTLQAMKKSEETGDGSETPAYNDGGTSPKQLIQTVVGGLTAREEEERAGLIKKVEFTRPNAPPPRKGMRQFKLETVTKPLEPDKLDSMSIAIFKRMLDAEKMASMNHIHGARTKILSCITSQFGGRLKDILQDYIFDDLRNRYDIAFSWLFQEFSNCQGFTTALVPSRAVDMASYDECLTRLLKSLSELPDQKDGLFHRLILEAPVITDNAMQIIRRYCSNEAHTEAGMKILRDLIMMRPKNRLGFLDLMLAFASHERQEIRNPAIQTAQKLYENPQLQPSIELYAVKQLKQLLAPKPDPDLKRWPLVDPDGWGEEAVKSHLYLYLGLLPQNHALIHELANIYTATAPDIKRTVLRVLEEPVRGMGMDSPELLRLVENCPKGSETLVMRVIHVLTEKAVPSPELVDRIRDLYHKRVPDVRFLIPVLNGLSKKEVIGALPKLIKLNPMVVKEVFNRLMGAHITANASYVSPLTPDELLVSLHNIDPDKCDMKTIIKAANLCFSERNIYTQEVLAIVMQRLMEQTPLPTLLMRTVIQSLSMYPRLIGFVLNILQRLIVKQVWNQNKVWEGFIKCCQRTKPQSFQVLLQLPAAQLSNVFQVSPDLRIPLLNHVRSFTPNQLTHIPPEIMTVLETDPAQDKLDEPMDQTPADQQPEAEPPPPGVSEPHLPVSLPSDMVVSTGPRTAVEEAMPISTITAIRKVSVQQPVKKVDKPAAPAPSWIPPAQQAVSSPKKSQNLSKSTATKAIEKPASTPTPKTTQPQPTPLQTSPLRTALLATSQTPIIASSTPPRTAIASVSQTASTTSQSALEVAEPSVLPEIVSSPAAKILVETLPNLSQNKLSSDLLQIVKKEPGFELESADSSNSPSRAESTKQAPEKQDSLAPVLAKETRQKSSSDVSSKSNLGASQSTGSSAMVSGTSFSSEKLTENAKSVVRSTVQQSLNPEDESSRLGEKNGGEILSSEEKAVQELDTGKRRSARSAKEPSRRSTRTKK